jgi:hypothetical protein
MTNPISRRSLLKAGAALAAVGFPGLARVAHADPRLVKVPIYIELTHTRKFLASAFDFRKLAECVGSVNSRPFGPAATGRLLLTGYHTERNLANSGDVQEWVSFTILRRSSAWNDIIRPGGKTEGLHDSRGRSIYRVTDFGEVLPPPSILLRNPESVTVEEFVVSVPKDTLA